MAKKKNFKNIKYKIWGFRMVMRLRAPTLLPKGPSLVPSTHMAAHNYL